MLSNRTTSALALSAVTGLATLTGCQGSDHAVTTPTPAASGSATSSTVTSETTAAEPSLPAPTTSRVSAATSTDPQAVAAGLKTQISQIGTIVKVTEDNDANNLIGRPGQYDAATFVQDKRLECTSEDEFDELSVDCGAKIERWASNADAKARVADIQKKLKDYGLGAEYDYVRSSLVLRVAGDLKPSEAQRYQRAFTG